MKGHHAAFRVADFEGSKRWLIKKLDFRIVVEWADDDNLRLVYPAPANDSRFCIEIIGDGDPNKKPAYRGFKDSLRQAGDHHLCLNVDNLDKTVAELKRREVSIVQEPL